MQVQAALLLFWHGCGAEEHEADGFVDGLGATPAAEVPAVVPQAAPPVPAGALLDQLQEGDILFHQSKSSQSRAIAMATKSRYTHMGMLIEVDGDLVVLEAVQPVSLTSVSAWVARGEDDHVVVKRLSGAQETLTPDAKEQLRQLGLEFVGRPYDLQFGWSDDRIYCSELVYKVYERSVGVQIGDLAELGSFDLSHAEVRSKLEERYGDAVPLDEPVISPQQMFDSHLLVTVGENP